jgi:LemA protein
LAAALAAAARDEIGRSSFPLEGGIGAAIDVAANTRGVKMTSSVSRSFSRPILIITFALSALVLSGCGYNTMVSMKENINAAWSQVENQLQRRNDLIPNLVETTKGYAAHEKEIFENIANARARLIGAGSREEKIEAANEVSSALSRLLVIAERYPDLKANQQFARLSDELAGTENRIATERRRYNEAVQAYNAYIQSFPTVVYAGWFGFRPEKYFEAPESARQVPQVKF